MNKIDFQKSKMLFEDFYNIYARGFTPTEKDLADEFKNRLNVIDQICDEIVGAIFELFPLNTLVPDENDTVIFGPFKIKLERAMPNTPIKIDNSTTAYPRGDHLGAANTGSTKTERQLERLTEEFYHSADRMMQLAKKIPGLKTFKSTGVTIVCNQLIKHPEGNGSGVTYDTFSYSINEGPFVKGLRRDDQTKHMDQGFKKNVEEFIINLNNSLKHAMGFDKTNNLN